jgi:hypothetical protein
MITSPDYDVNRAKVILLAEEGLSNDFIAARLDTPRRSSASGASDLPLADYPAWTDALIAGPEECTKTRFLMSRNSGIQKTLLISRSASALPSTQTPNIFVPTVIHRTAHRIASRHAMNRDHRMQGYY